MKKLLLLATILFLANSALYALTIHVAPIKYYTSGKADTTLDIRELLIVKLSSYFRWEKLSFKALATAIETPASIADAMRITYTHSLDYLLYGYIEENETSLNCEIKLFDGQKQEIVQAFYSSDTRGEVLRLLDDIAGKIAIYFNKVLGMAVTGDDAPVPTEGIISFAIGGGYWLPLAAQWSMYIQPLYSACLDIRFIPWRPAEGGGIRGFYFRTGLTGNFNHSNNLPGYEAFDLFTFTFGIPAYLCLDIAARHTLSLGITPEFAFDYLVREKLYDNINTTLVLFFSGSADLEYQFHFSPNFCMSMVNRATVQFIYPPRFLYNTALLFEISLDPLSQSRTGEYTNE